MFTFEQVCAFLINIFLFIRSIPATLLQEISVSETEFLHAFFPVKLQKLHEPKLKLS